MKSLLKALAIIFVVGISFTLVWAATNEVVSVNIVGYQKLTLERGKLNLLSTSFNNPTGGILKSAHVFSNQVPNGTTVYAYDPVTKTYVIDSKNFAGWSTNITYDGGMGFWIQVPASAPSNSYEVTMMGEVPMESTNANLVANPLTLLGYPFTASVLWTNTTLAKTAVNGDVLYLYNTSNGTYSIYSKNFLGWGAATSLVITPYMGFWYKTTSAAHTNLEGRPYNP